MESSNDRKLFYIALAVILLLLVSTSVALIFNSKNKKSLNAEKLRYETVLSEKLQAEKELEKVKNDLASLRSKLAETEKSLSDIKGTVADKEKKLATLSRDSYNYNKAKKELTELQNKMAEIDRQYSGLKSDYDKLMSQNNDLQNSLSQIESQKRDLAAKLEQAEMYNTDNFATYGTRGKKEKITFYACRTRKLNLNFDVPQSLTEGISFRIITPDGNTITPEDKALSWNVNMDPALFTASLSAITGEFESSRQVNLRYAPKDKLKPGEYKIQILCNTRNIGNCRIKLK
jgi:myosin heavy subunit